MQTKNKEQYKHMSKEEKHQKIKDLRIIHPRFKRALDLIQKCHESTKNSKDPQCMLITGVSGSGKSTIFDAYIQLKDRIVYEETRTRKVILWAEIPSPTTIMSFLETLLEQLGDPFPSKGTKGNKHRRLINLIKDCGVELIILDEFQHFVHPHNKKINYDVSDCFKSIVNQTKVPVVLFGLEESKYVLDCNEQLRRRFSIRYNMSSFGSENQQRIREFTMLLSEFDRLLPFAEPIGLDNPEMVERFFYATDGLMDSIIKIIRDAADIAIEKEQETIYLNDFAKAYNLHAHLRMNKKKHPFAEGEFLQNNQIEKSVK
ncbi:TPA: TniB family NTP-binding protein [Bacillus pseudomycoides]|nr:TniB family NTP-binding protein [Bacillus pseudomycoides]